MCLVCGFVGCLRKVTYKPEDCDVPTITCQQAGHSFDHFQTNLHIYSQNIESQEVWDFSKVSHQSTEKVGGLRKPIDSELD